MKLIEAAAWASTVVAVIGGIYVVHEAADAHDATDKLAITSPLNAEVTRMQLALKTSEAKREYAEGKAKYMDPSCVGFDCQGLFTSETAGIISTVYLDYAPEVWDMRDFCMMDDRVNMWRGYAGATLMEFGATDVGKGRFIMHCGWLVPSKVWCKK